MSDSAMPLQVIIAEQAPVISAGLEAVIKDLKDPECAVTVAEDMEALRAAIRRYPGSVVVVDPTFCGVLDPQSLRRESTGDTHILAIETGPVSTATRALYDDTLPIADDTEAIAARLRRVTNTAAAPAEEKETLSNREKEIVALVTRGLTNKEIADKLYLSVHTVVTHRRNIARKLEIHSATGLTIYAIVNGIVPLSDLTL